MTVFIDYIVPHLVDCCNEFHLSRCRAGLHQNIAADIPSKECAAGVTLVVETGQASSEGDT